MFSLTLSLCIGIVNLTFVADFFFSILFLLLVLKEFVNFLSHCRNPWRIDEKESWPYDKLVFCVKKSDISFPLGINHEEHLYTGL